MFHRLATGWVFLRFRRLYWWIKSRWNWLAWWKPTMRTLRLISECTVRYQLVHGDFRYHHPIPFWHWLNNGPIGQHSIEPVKEKDWVRTAMPFNRKSTTLPALHWLWAWTSMLTKQDASCYCLYIFTPLRKANKSGRGLVLQVSRLDSPA